MLSSESLDVFGEYTKSLFVHNGLKYRLSEYTTHGVGAGRMMVTSDTTSR